MNTPREYLATYLNDHLAGAAAALEVLDALQNVDNSEFKRFAHELCVAIAEDRDELMRLMRTADIETSHVRRAVGWIGEKAAELKLTLDDPSDGGLRTFERLEVVALGIDGKRALWAVLQTISVVVPGLRDADYARLARRADDQRAAVEARRLECAKATFAGGSR